MEERKLIKHGPSSLTIALPKKWLDARGLKKGDGIYVAEEGNKLILNTKKALKIDKISIAVTGLDTTSIYHYIQSLYRYGYNEIEVCFEDQSTKKHRDGQLYPVSFVVHEKIRRYLYETRQIPPVRLKAVSVWREFFVRSYPAHQQYFFSRQTGARLPW